MLSRTNVMTWVAMVGGAAMVGGVGAAVDMVVAGVVGWCGFIGESLV